MCHENITKYALATVKIVRLVNTCELETIVLRDIVDGTPIIRKVLPNFFEE